VSAAAGGRFAVPSVRPLPPAFGSKLMTRLVLLFAAIGVLPGW
jgi:hypothetical protein